MPQCGHKNLRGVPETDNDTLVFTRTSALDSGTCTLSLAPLQNLVITKASVNWQEIGAISCMVTIQKFANIVGL
jgi:hypothetical protein